MLQQSAGWGERGRIFFSFDSWHWFDRSSWNKKLEQIDSTQDITILKCVAVSYGHCGIWEAMLPVKETSPPPTALRIHSYTNMPLIHSIDFYLTFKFCPLTKAVGFLYVCWGCVGWSFACEASTKASQGRWELLLKCVCVTFTITAIKKTTFYFAMYVLRLNSDDIMMRWILYFL